MATVLQCGDKQLDLASPRIMGILNITPDSFSDGGLFVSATDKTSNIFLDKVLQHTQQMIADGASIIDIGGESTRPGAEAVSKEEERRRVIPLVSRIKSDFPDCLISVDTSKPEIMKEAIDAGAHIINDVNALRAPGAVDTIAESKVGVCLMHMQGQPRTMQKEPHYDNVVEEILAFLQDRIDVCREAGISLNRIIIDPGFGFGKTLQHNLQLFKYLHRFKELGAALLVGVSRKSMIGKILDKDVDERLSGSLGLAALATWSGADIIRVHDVAESVDVMKVIHAVQTV